MLHNLSYRKATPVRTLPSRPEYPIGGFLRLLDLEPQLSSCIKHISISNAITSQEGEERSLAEIKTNLDLLGLGGMKKRSHRVKDVEDVQDRENFVEVELAALVLQAHNVETIQMNAWQSDQANSLPI
jgi:hypothetical protein